MADEFNTRTCDAKHAGINWMFGTLVTLQLMCFSWLGYLSAKVMAVDAEFAQTKGALTQKLTDIDVSLQHLIAQMDRAQMDRK